MAKILELFPKRKYVKDGTNLETHPLNQRYWKRVVEGLEELYTKENLTIKTKQDGKLKK